MMICSHAPLALLGSIGVATPIAQAAPSVLHAQAGHPLQLRAVGGLRVAQRALQETPSPSLSITICWSSHCVTISF